MTIHNVIILIKSVSNKNKYNHSYNIFGMLIKELMLITQADYKSGTFVTSGILCFNQVPVIDVMIY